MTSAHACSAACQARDKYVEQPLFHELKFAFQSRLFLWTVSDIFDFVFAENGLTAIKLGQVLESQSFINFIGEDKYKKLVKFVLHYIADMDIPIKR